MSRSKSMSRSKERANARSASAKASSGDGARDVDVWLRAHNDWRGETLARARRLVREAEPDVVEEIKWRKPTNPAGVPVWSRDGILAMGEAYKDKVKITFARGAALDDPSKLFNAGFGGGTRRAIDLREGEALDAEAFKALVRAAVAENRRTRALKSG